MTSDSLKDKRSKKGEKPLWKKAFAYLAAIAFFGTTISTVANLYRSALQSGQETAAEEVPSAADQLNALEAQEKGYLIVLEREPENQTALEGLVQTRLEMGNLEEAISPLETLVSLHPDRQDYQAILAQLKEDTASQ